MNISTNNDGLIEGYLSECEDKNRTLEWKLSEATKEIARLRNVIKGLLALYAPGALIGSTPPGNESIRFALEALDRTRHDDDD